MDLRQRTILVTGGAGFIGSHLVDALIDLDCSVRVLDDLSNGKTENLAKHHENRRFEFFRGSVTNPGDVEKSMTGASVVFHLACLGVRHSIREPFENHRVNAEGTLLVLEKARALRVERFVCCSSSEVYGTAVRTPMPEEHETSPCTVYGASKLAGEAYARAFFRTHGLASVVVRPFNSFGPRSHYEGDAGEAIPKFIVRALAGEPLFLFGDGRQTRDFTFVEDTARALLSAAGCDQAVGQTLNAGSGFEMSIRHVAETVIALTGSRSAIREIEPRPGDVKRLFADSSRIHALTGWAPAVSFEDGLKRTIAWFDQQPGGPGALLKDENPRNWL